MAGVDPKLLEILVCPLCKGKLVYRKAEDELVANPTDQSHDLRTIES